MIRIEGVQAAYEEREKGIGNREKTRRSLGKVPWPA